MYSEKIIYQSQTMDQLLAMVKKVSRTEITCLITGPTGSGKELIARKLHNDSPRGQRPFVAINCAALSESLFESEVFGHEKGSFSGAYCRKIGLAEVANGGTLFLDEIGDLSLPNQAKILRLIQERVFYRVGSTHPIEVNIRVISATHRNLEGLIKSREFREDLFHRINTMTLELPALAERREDIPLLLNHFAENLEFSPKSMAILSTYNWPGNVRELRNLCEKLKVILTGNTVSTSDLPETFKGKRLSGGVNSEFDPSIPLYIKLAEIEKMYISSALEKFDCNQMMAAKSLGMARATFRLKMEQYGITMGYEHDT